jgi:hypothetical protein
MGGEAFTKDGQLYLDWETGLQNELRAVGLLRVLEEEPPSDLTSSTGVWWKQADALIFNGLIKVVPPFAYSKLIHLGGQPNSTREFLRLLKQCYWQPSTNTDFQLEDELNKLGPRDKETMVDFLSRAEDLGRRCHNYGFPVEETRLCRAVCRHLDDTWMPVMEKFGDDRTKWTWNQVSTLLQTEDNKRRQFMAKSTTSVFPPLGMSRRGRAFMISATPQGLSPIRTRQRGILRSTGSPENTPRRGSQSPRNLQCYYCKTWGHGWNGCAPPNWENTTQGKAQISEGRKQGTPTRGGGKYGGSKGGSRGSSRASSGKASPKSPRRGGESPKRVWTPRTLDEAAQILREREAAREAVRYAEQK